MVPFFGPPRICEVLHIQWRPLHWQVKANAHCKKLGVNVTIWYTTVQKKFSALFTCRLFVPLLVNLFHHHCLPLLFKLHALDLVSWFWKKIIKTVATRCHILRLKALNSILAAAGPALEAHRAIRPPNWIWGVLLIRDGKGKEGEKGKSKGGERKEGKAGERRKGGKDSPHPWAKIDYGLAYL